MALDDSRNNTSGEDIEDDESSDDDECLSAKKKQRIFFGKSLFARKGQKRGSGVGTSHFDAELMRNLILYAYQPYESWYNEYADDDTFEQPGMAVKPFWNFQTNTIMIATADVTEGFMIIYNQSVIYKTYKSANFEYTAIGKKKGALELI